MLILSGQEIRESIIVLHFQKTSNAYPVTEMPISLPIPKVIAAAAKPKNTCLNPEYQTFFPVNNVIAAPIIKSPDALAETLRIMAFIPLVNMKGKTGMTAPIANRMKE